MERDLKKMIDMGRKQMYQHENYEEAEKIFLHVAELEEYSGSHTETLLRICRRKQAEHVKKLRDCKTKIKGTANHTKYSKACLEYEGGKEGGPLFKGGGSKEEGEIISPYCKEDETRDQFESGASFTENPVMNTQYETKDTINEDKNIQRPVEHFYRKERDQGGIYTAHDSQYDKTYDLGKEKELKQISEEYCKGRKMYEQKPRELFTGFEEEENKEKREQIIKHCKKDETNVQLEREAEMLCMSFKLRVYVLQFGLKTFSSKPNYRQDVNFEHVTQKIDELILRARNSFHLNNEKECEYYLSKAEKMYSEVAIILPQASISKPKTETKANSGNNNSEYTTENSTSANIKSTSYKDFVRGDNIDVIKCLNLAESAIMAKDFKKAERLIKKSERICPTKNARELLKNLETAKLEAARQAAEQYTKELAEQAALQAGQQAAKAAEEQTENEAETPKTKIESVKEKIEIKGNIALEAVDVMKESESSKPAKNIVDELAAKDCIMIAQAALDNNNFTKAERMTLKAKRLDPNIDIENLQSQIKIAFASRSSSEQDPSLKTEDNEIFFQPTDDKKRNSKECVKISDIYLKKNNIRKAEQFLYKAKDYYNSNNLKEKFEQIENLKKAEKAYEGSYEIPEPSFCNSNSETCFAYEPNRVYPSYQIAKDQNTDVVFLQQRRMALVKDDLEKTEEYAHKSEKVCPVCAQGLLPDITISKNIGQGKGTSTLRYHMGKDQDTVEVFLQKGRMALTNGDLEKAEEYALKSKKVAPVRAQGLLQDINVVKKLRQGNGTSTLRSGRTWRDPVETDNNSDVELSCMRLIIAAEQEISERNLQNAEDILYKAEKLQPTAEAQKLLVQIKNMRLKAQSEYEAVHIKKQDQSFTSSENILQIEKNINPHRNNIQYLIDEAEKAYLLNDFDNAEYLFKKAYDICPVEKIQTFIIKIQNEREKILNVKDSNSIYHDTRKILGEEINPNLQEAKHCVESAEQALGLGDLDKAERMFQKALRMNPLDYVSDCLIKVQREKVKISLEEEKSRKADEVFKVQCTSENHEKAEKFVCLALSAFDFENYYTAEKYLTKALCLSYSDSTADILAKVRESINKNIRVRSNEQKSKHKNKNEQEKEIEMTIEAKKYLKTAEKQLTRGDLVNAQSSVIISDSFSPSKESEQLLDRIIELQFNDFKEKKRKIQDYFKFKSEFYIESAKIAIANGDLKLAEKYLIHSDKAKHSAIAETMLQEVRTAMNNPKQNTSTSRQKSGGVLSTFFNFFKK